MLHGVDVHCEYQAGLDIELLARQGFAFVAVKATEGAAGYTAPPRFNEWVDRTRQAGMVPGAYHWLNNSNPVDQAHHFLDRVAKVGGPGGLLLQIDCEDVSAPAGEATVRAFIAEMNTATAGQPLAFYSGAWWYAPHLGGFRVADLGVRSWHSRYVTATRGTKDALAQFVAPSWWTPGYGGFDRATFLQYTSRGDAGGLVANVDLNLFDGTADQLHALTAGGDMTPEEHNWLMGCYWEGRKWAGGALETATRVETAVATLAKVVASIAEKVDIDPAELAAIEDAAQAGASAALTAASTDLAAKIVAGLRDEIGEVNGDVVERVVRRVFADAATPDQPAASG